MKKIILCLITSIFILNAAQNKVLTISSQEIYITKICDAIIKEALESINIDVKTVLFPTKRALMLSNSGKTDAESCRVFGFNKKYKNLIRIDPSIVPLKANVFTKNLKLKITQGDWSTLKPYKIGIHSGHYYSEKQTKGFPHVSTLTSDIQILNMINKGRLDLGVFITADALYDIKKNNLTKDIKIIEPAINTYPLHFYVHKNNKHLVPKIQKAIENIVKSNRANEIYNQYINKTK